MRYLVLIGLLFLACGQEEVQEVQDIQEEIRVPYLDAGTCTCKPGLLACPDPKTRKVLGFCMWQEQGQFNYPEAIRVCVSKGAQLCNSFQVNSAVTLGVQRGGSWMNTGASSSTGGITCPSDQVHCLSRTFWTYPSEDLFPSLCCMP